MSVENQVLVFQETEFDVVDVNGQVWLKGMQVGAALGYSDPSVAVRLLFERNEDEFDDTTTQLVELSTSGGTRPVRVFSARGCYLLGMLARTDNAKAFRRWVLDVLEGQAAPRLRAEMSFSQHLGLLKYRGALVKELRLLTEQGTAEELYANLCRVSRMLGMSVGALPLLAPSLTAATE